MAKKVMTITVNAWSVGWDEDKRRSAQPCALKTDCKGEPTQGVGVFTFGGKPKVVVGCVLNPSVCSACAIAYVVGEGLKGTLTLAQVIEHFAGAKAASE